MKEVDPIGAYKARKGYPFGNFLLWSRIYFTSVAIQFEKKEKTFQKLPNVIIGHQHEATGFDQHEATRVSDEVSILHLIQKTSNRNTLSSFNLCKAITYIALNL